MRPLLIISAILAVLLAGCASKSMQTEETIKGMGRVICQCHYDDHEKAKAKALAIFNFNKPNWVRGMDSRQLDFFFTRIEGGLDPDTRQDILDFLNAEKVRQAH